MTSKTDEFGLALKERQVADLYRGGSDDIRGNAKLCFKKVYPRAKDSTAETKGPALLRKGQVRAYLALKEKEASEAADITSERILRDLSELADMCLGRKAMPQGTVDVDGVKEIVNVIEVNPNGAKGALELLGKHKKLFTDKVEHLGNIQVNLHYGTKRKGEQ